MSGKKETVVSLAKRVEALETQVESLLRENVNIRTVLDTVVHISASESQEVE